MSRLTSTVERLACALSVPRAGPFDIFAQTQPLVRVTLSYAAVTSLLR